MINALLAALALSFPVASARQDATGSGDDPEETGDEGSDEERDDDEDDGDEEPEAPATPGEEPVPLRIDTGEAVDAGTLSPEQADWLKPRLSLLPPNPRAQTDFTAYTLEWGEVKLGLANIQIGVLPGLQAGTSVPLDALRVPNGNLKFDFLRLGPLDLAATGAGYWLRREGFDASYLAAGGMLSVKVVEAWSLHGGASHAWIGSDGFPPLDSLSHWITGAEVTEQVPELADASLRARLLQVRFATDVRFNRRDSLVLQVASIPWARVTTDPVPEEIPPVFGLDRILALDGPVPVAQSYTASLAWQIQWKHAQLRLGIGHSSTPAAWLTQCLDFSWRFLGATRLAEYRQRRAWKRNQEAAEEGTLDAGGQPAP